MWMGGPVPLGYDVVDRKLVVKEVEAKQVRHIMTRYLEVGSVRSMVDELATAGLRTKLRPLRNGTSIGGVAFSRGGLFHLLSNCVYVGEVRHKGATYDGVHAAIIERDLWDRVQASLADKAPARTRRANIRHPSILAGLVHDGHGRQMTPSHAVKQAKRYRYYMTRERQPGSPASWRVPAHDLEQLVIARLCRHLVEERCPDCNSSLDAYGDTEWSGTSQVAKLIGGSDIDRTDIVKSLLERIDVRRDCVELALRPAGEEERRVLTASATLIRSGRQTRLVPPGMQTSANQAPDEGLIKLIANARAARLALANACDQPIEVIAESNGFTRHYFAQLARLGGLAPDIVAAILEGRQPANLTRTRLARTKALPLDWNQQRQMFGFA
jgi:site-specific DNA recombinase